MFIIFPIIKMQMSYNSFNQYCVQLCVKMCQLKVENKLYVQIFLRKKCKYKPLIKLTAYFITNKLFTASVNDAYLWFPSFAHFLMKMCFVEVMVQISAFQQNLDLIVTVMKRKRKPVVSPHSDIIKIFAYFHK